MADRVLVISDIFTGLANIIRTNKGVTTTYTPAQIAAQIPTLSGNLPSGNINLTNYSTTYNVKAYATAKIVDSNLTSANIKSGITILGITGKSSVKETNDANATAADITLNKTAYVNGAKITGSAKPTVSGATCTFPTDWCR